jgi:hypothetical protein
MHLAVDDEAGEQLGKTWPSTVTREGGDQRVRAVGSDNGFEFDYVRPAGVKDADGLDAGVGDGAVIDHLYLVGSMAAESRLSLFVDGQTDPSPPGQTFVIAGNRLDLNCSFDPGHPAELIGNSVGLQSALSLQADVLKVAAATLTGTRMGTRWLDPIR